MLKNKFLAVLFCLMIFALPFDVIDANTYNEEAVLDIQQKLDTNTKHHEEFLVKHFNKILGSDINGINKTIEREIVLDLRDNLEAIKKSFEEPIVLYREILTIGDGTKTDSCRIFYKGREVSYARSITAPIKGEDRDWRRLEETSFSWAFQEQEHTLDYVTVEDSLEQRCGDKDGWLGPPMYKDSGVYSWPEHYNSGYYSNDHNPGGYAYWQAAGHIAINHIIKIHTYPYQEGPGETMLDLLGWGEPDLWLWPF